MSLGGIAIGQPQVVAVLTVSPFRGSLREAEQQPRPDRRHFAVAGSGCGQAAQRRSAFTSVTPAGRSIACSPTLVVNC